MIRTGSNPFLDTNSKAIAVIPARLASTRLPEKLLLEVGGKPLICWVAEKAAAASSVSRVIVATDDLRLKEAVEKQGFAAVMTGAHNSGTDRVAEVARNVADEFIVNVQGDEPLISPQTIDAAVLAVWSDAKADIGTTWELIEEAADVLNPAVVKVVVDQQERALYFSRSPVPFPRDAVSRHGTLAAALAAEPALVGGFKKHTGLYVYRRESLLRFTALAPSCSEKTEALEQLRALEHGMKIVAVRAASTSVGVDTAEDFERVKQILEGEAADRKGESVREVQFK